MPEKKYIHICIYNILMFFQVDDCQHKYTKTAMLKLKQIAIVYIPVLSKCNCKINTTMLH